jgi:hypothetical protein
MDMLSAMQAPQTALTGVASVTSAVRLGLIDVNPVERHRIIEKSGLKFRVMERMLEPKETSVQTIEQYTTFLGETIAKGIPLPSWGDREKLSTHLAKMIREGIEQDPELRRTLEESLSGAKDRRLLSGIYNLLVFMQERHRSKREQALELEAQRFLASDLPLWVFSRFMCYRRNYEMYLDYLVQRIKYYRLRLTTGEVRSSYSAFRKLMNQAREELKPIIDTVDGETLAYLALITYLKVWNSTDYDEIDKVDFISLTRVDNRQFREMFDAFETALVEATQRLFESGRVEFQIEIDDTDPTVRMVRNVTLDGGT